VLVGVPLMVKELPVVPPGTRPGGRAPEPIAHVYGAVPPLAVQVARYVTPSAAGPVLGEQFTLSGGVFELIVKFRGPVVTPPEVTVTAAVPGEAIRFVATTASNWLGPM
jgi:hypothetical protein